LISLKRRSAWQTWRDVIFALFAREIRIGFNDKFGLSWAVVQPILFILLLSFLRGRLNGGDTHSLPTFVFMAYGLLTIQMFIQTFTACFNAVKKNMALFAFRQVQPLSAVIAAALFELLVKIFVIVGIVIAMSFFGIELRVNNPLAVLYYFLSVWVLAVAMGLFFAIAAIYIPELKKIQSLITRPLFFLSAVFFSLQDVPKDYWWLLNWNPILHAIELSRYSAYPTYGSNGVSSVFLGVSVLFIAFMSLFFYHAMWKKAISR